MKLIISLLLTFLCGCNSFKPKIESAADQYKRYKVVETLKRELLLEPADLLKLKLALELAPKDSEVLELWARALVREGNVREAMQVLRAISESDPSFAPAWRDMGLLLKFHGENELGAEYCAIALRLNGLDLAARRCLGGPAENASAKVLEQVIERAR